MPTGLTENQKREYLENGFLPIERLFDPGQLDTLIVELNGVVRCMGGAVLRGGKTGGPVR